MAQTVHVARADELGAALGALELLDQHPVLVVVGGAQTLAGAQLDAVQQLFGAVVVPLCDELGAVVVDGGTDAGVMAAMGRARDDASGRFALVGVMAAGTIVGAGVADDAATVVEPARLERHHTHVIVVPGVEWGDESPWIIDVAATLAAGSPVAGLLAGGGEVSARDVDNLVGAGYPVVVLAGTGGLADRLASDDTPLVTVVEGLTRPADLETTLRAVLAR